LLISLAFITLIFFSSFDAPLSRTIADEAADSQLLDDDIPIKVMGGEEVGFPETTSPVSLTLEQ